MPTKFVHSLSFSLFTLGGDIEIMVSSSKIVSFPCSGPREPVPTLNSAKRTSTPASKKNKLLPAALTVAAVTLPSALQMGAVGDGVGAIVGASVGDTVGARVGDVVGDSLGERVGDSVGEFDGDTVGDCDGEFVGDMVGETVGARVGDFVGAVGDIVGDSVGARVGTLVGADDGAGVGTPIEQYSTKSSSKKAIVSLGSTVAAGATPTNTKISVIALTSLNVTFASFSGIVSFESAAPLTRLTVSTCVND